MANIEVGSKVKYLGIEGKPHMQLSPCYPPVETVGTVLDVGKHYDATIAYIKWPEGTTADDGKWYCDVEFLEVVDEK